MNNYVTIRYIYIYLLKNSHSLLSVHNSMSKMKIKTFFFHGQDQNVSKRRHFNIKTKLYY